MKKSVDYRWNKKRCCGNGCFGYLMNAVCSVVPLFFEFGTRFKILESGACRIPVVSTTLGAEGIPVQHGKHCLIANTTQSFVDAILAVMGDNAFAGSLAENCQMLVKDNYGIAALASEAKTVLEYLFSNKYC